MKITYLDFEQPLGELEGKIEQLRYVQADSAVDISEEISRLQQKSQTLTKDIYSKLTPWQTSMVARHPQRPYTLDYVRERRAFGQRILDFQNTQFKLADLKTKATVARVFTDRCISLFMEGKLDPVDAARCKRLLSAYGFVSDPLPPRRQSAPAVAGAPR